MTDATNVVVTNRRASFDILPSMPRVSSAPSDYGGGDYAMMAALPPMSAVRQNLGGLPHQHKQFAVEKHLRLVDAALPNNNHNNNSNYSIRNHQLVPTDYAQQLSLHNNNNYQSVATGGLIGQPQDSSIDYTVERIEKQRQMLAGGGSLFLTSPRSFLTGRKRNAF